MRQVELVGSNMYGERTAIHQYLSASYSKTERALLKHTERNKPMSKKRVVKRQCKVTLLHFKPKKVMKREKSPHISLNMCFQIPLKASIVVEFLSLCVLSS